MEFLAGALIALAISMTGIGAGTITAPVLMLAFGMPAPQAVATALVFGTVIKLLVAPAYMARGKVNWRVLGYLCLGGIPGVLAGSLVLQYLNAKALNGPVLLLVGATVLFSATMNLLRWRKPEVNENKVDHAPRLPWVTAPIGLEVGFSSAGAGALGTLALFHFTTLAPAEVVGTDLLFGLAISGVGSGVHWSMTAVPTEMLAKLLAGGMPAALCGAWLATRVPARKLKLGLCVWLLYLGGQLLYRGTGMVLGQP